MSYTLNYRGAKIDELLGQVDEQFIAEYNVSLYADITAAIAAGKQVLLKKDNALYPYIGTDASSSYTFAMVDEDAILQLFTVSTASVWATVSKALQEELTFDAAPTDGSTNPVTSDGIYDAIEEAKSEIATSDQPGMTVGASDNLISDAKISNSSPYLYRPVLNGVGNRAYSKLIGATIANNQLVQNGNFADTTGWSVYNCALSASSNEGTVTCTSPASGGGMLFYQNQTQSIVGHKYFASAKIYIPSANTSLRGVAFGIRGATLPYTTLDTWQTCNSIVNCSAANSIVMLSNTTAAAVNDYYRVKLVNIKDLTQDFGSTIADYAYTLETQTAGSGIAWLKSYGFFGKYAPYDAGSLISTKAEKKKVVGKNLFNSANGEEGKWIDNTGAETSDSHGYVSEMMGCPPVNSLVLNANEYSASGGFYASAVVFYDAEQNFISRDYLQSSTNHPVNTIPATARYIKVEIYQSNLTVTKSLLNEWQIQLEIGSTPTTYEEYTSQEYDLGGDELQGLFKLDANNNIVAEGDTKVSSGLITRNYHEITLTGDDVYTFDTGNNQVVFKDLTSDYQKAGTAGISNQYVGIVAAYWANLGDKEFAFHPSNGKTIHAKDASITSLASAISAFNANPLKIVYELATPTTEQGTPFIDPSIVYPNGTEEYIDTRTVPVPVGNDTEYTEDLKGGLETILDTPSANGTYVLKATVSGGVATLSWVSE